MKVKVSEIDGSWHPSQEYLGSSTELRPGATHIISEGRWRCGHLIFRVCWRSRKRDGRIEIEACDGPDGEYPYALIDDDGVPIDVEDEDSEVLDFPAVCELVEKTFGAIAPWREDLFKAHF